MRGRDPTSADSAQRTVTRNARKIGKIPDSTDADSSKAEKGSSSSEGDTATAIENFARQNSQDIDHGKVPEKQNRILAEFFGTIKESGGFQALDEGEMEVNQTTGQEVPKPEELGIVKSEGDTYEPTRLVEDKLPKVFEHQGGKYNRLKAQFVDQRDELFEDILTEEQDGSKMNALYIIGRKETDPAALESATGIDAREFLYELDQRNLVEFSRIGVTTSEEGELLKDMLEESYEVMVRNSRERAESYVNINENIGYVEGVIIKGHRELVAQELDKKIDELPEELEAFEDY